MIHPTAIIDPSAKLADDVEVGPYSIIGPDVEIGAGSRIESHVVLKGPTRIGRNNHIFQFATVGDATPDLKFKGEDTRLVIGDDNVIREGVTIHRGTVQDRAETTIGNGNLLMPYVHIGHDNVIGNHCIFVNNAALAGHVHVGDYAQLSGFTLVHQFCDIGPHSFTAMGTAVGKDVPAYVMVTGNPAEAKSVNLVGLKRRGFTKDEQAIIVKAFKIIYRRHLRIEEAKAELTALAASSPVVQPMLDSLNRSTRGIVR
ncbi:acyl-ACP--UDP-N-acetylglucosamine O-acyltransferase [Gilvimarinus sp. F26214L]|uniref:acyl-ACP--UDP-N-acetylglucosamine O-acyltransferase n=1 Tax=Gilvimarinus sp. DZF01 TaxID=3461371 RepID=UPI004046101B